MLRFKHLLLLVVAALLIASSVTGFVSLSSSYYYGAILLLGLTSLSESRGISVGSKLLLVFILICAFSIVINDPPAYFRAWQRLIAFALIILIVSPLFISTGIYCIRFQLFTVIMWLCVWLSVGSFFCYFLGINFFVRNEEILAIEAGHFSGLFSHSMLLGPISGLSAIFVFATWLGKRRRPLWLLIVMICCIGSNILAASRGAIGACLLGLIVAFVRYYRGRLSRGFIIGILVLGLVVASFPLWEDLTGFVVTKQDSNLSSGGTFVSREYIWRARLAEIRNHPITGVGFCCVDSGLSYVDKRTGIIEPGSSWLAVFSMTGFFGFLCFLSVYIGSFVRALHNSLIDESCMMLGGLAFFAFHLLIEGYVLASGSFLGLLFWLLLGCIWKKI